MAIEKLATALATLLENAEQASHILAAFRETSKFGLDNRPESAEQPTREIQAIVAPRPLFLERNQPGIEKDAQMPGNARLSHLQDGRQFLHGEFATRQDRQQTQTGLVGQCFKS